MKGMVLLKATRDSESGTMLSTELLEAMGKFTKADVLLAGEGLKASEWRLMARTARSRTAPSRQLAIGGRLLAVASNEHGRDHRVGEALPKSDARLQRNRDRPLFEVLDFNGAMTSELRKRKEPAPTKLG